MQSARQISQLDPSTLDYSALSQSDLANIVLQRSEVLSGIRSPGRIIRAWEEGDPEPLNKMVRSRGVVLAQRAAQVIRTEFEVLQPMLDRFRPQRIADIGAGYGFFDLFMHHRYGCSLLLIDVERNERRHFGFEEEAAAYTSLQTAREFLERNGVPPEHIETWNPEQEDPATDEKPDLAVSFLSCGYHFPVDMYLPFFRFGVAPRGRIILDLRAGHFQENKRLLEQLGPVQVLTQGGGRKRVIVWKGRG